MARVSWLNDESTPDLDAHVGKLEHFTQSLADGVIDAQELATQERNLVSAERLLSVGNDWTGPGRCRHRSLVVARWTGRHR